MAQKPQHIENCRWQTTATTRLVLAPTQIFMVEQHPTIRWAFRLLVESEPDLQICTEASSAKEAFDKLKHVSPDLFIVDAFLEDQSGFEMVAQVAEQLPEIPILMVSSYEASRHEERAREAGAWGFIQKCDLPEEGLYVIRCMLTSNPCLECPYRF